MDQQSPFPLSFRDLSEFLPVCSEPVDGGGDEEEEDSDEAAATTKRRFLKWEECWTQVITDKGPCYTTAAGKYEGIGTNLFLDLFKLKLILHFSVAESRGCWERRGERTVVWAADQGSVGQRTPV